jgi:hypothetical protein
MFSGRKADTSIFGNVDEVVELQVDSGAADGVGLLA